MKEQDVAMLSEAMQRRLAKTPLAFHRHLFDSYSTNGDPMTFMTRFVK